LIGSALAGSRVEGRRGFEASFLLAGFFESSLAVLKKELKL